MILFLFVLRGILVEIPLLGRDRPEERRILLSSIVHLSKALAINNPKKARTIEDKRPSLLGLSTSAAGVSYSTTLPLSSTRMRSMSITVVKRCAIVTTVQSANCSRIVRWITVSVS